MREIPLTQGKVAFVDDQDYDFLMQWKWRAAKTTGSRTCYAARHVMLDGNRYSTLYMHRAILAPENGVQVDHINGDGLCNLRSNLRMCTLTENARNKPPFKNGSSKFKGVSWHKNIRKWMAKIRCGDNQMHLGYFDSESDAALAYNKMASEIQGDFARINVVEQ